MRKKGRCTRGGGARLPSVRDPQAAAQGWGGEGRKTCEPRGARAEGPGVHPGAGRSTGEWIQGGHKRNAEKSIRGHCNRLVRDDRSEDSSQFPQCLGHPATYILDETTGV